MHDWAYAAISGGSGVLGALVGGGATYLTQRADRKDRERGELRAATSFCLYTLDALNAELNLLTPPRSRLERAIDRAVARRAPTIDWLGGVINRHTVGRPAMRALDQFLLAGNRLALVAPEPLLRELQAALALFEGAPERNADWQSRWAQAREGLQREARRVLDA